MPVESSAVPDVVAEESYTVDELAAITGMTVRTTRYYAGLGLLPPPMRRGRMAYYSAQHRARLELIRALQDHGFTLAAIEKYLARIPADASVEDLAVQKAMLTSWKTGGHEVVTRRQLETRAGRKLSEEDVQRLAATLAVEELDDGRYELLPAFTVGLQVLDLPIPVDSMVAAGEAINRHMVELADELTAVLKDRVLTPYLESPKSEADKAEFEQTMARLRQLTLEAVVSGFQRAANQVITRSLSR
ncbi:MerR family transcriptional regulator [Nocardioides marmoriginsengisoli]|uniref:MerR family transcriptional regulator n=1 Tax=Nocardioides marmoriginsengisoli TaxID=661483 RepID=A0A3N0CPQ1_9ACTN|nr:MerR family transcriptional regulator [Nocardioides marmoriginsengisoli]RNL65452.1 MerR family transcriptional regulator [Nocardioides marmoriginsengisoli]